jgi:hypothetical protein
MRLSQVSLRWDDEATHYQRETTMKAKRWETLFNRTALTPEEVERSGAFEAMRRSVVSEETDTDVAVRLIQARPVKLSEAVRRIRDLRK